MIVAGIDLGGDASRVAAEGKAALSIGETDRARERFQAAGVLLEAKISNLRKSNDKHLIRFLAASQYYHGGHYQKAQDLARKVDAKYLSSEAKPLFVKFFRDVQERSDPAYEKRIHKTLLVLWHNQAFSEILTLLQEHPYVLGQTDLTFLRAFCFEELRDWRSAAVFFADALNGTPDDPEAVLHPAAYLLSLAGQDRVSEAWEYAQYQLKALPNAVTFMTASMIRFQQANAMKGELEAEGLYREQIQYFEEAWRRYHQLPPKVRDFPLVREYMSLCFEIVIMGLQRTGQSERARQTCEVALSFAPNRAGLRTLRGTVTYPSDQAVEDFREAIRLGHQAYYPYYYLAHAALIAMDFTEVVSWCKKALERQPSPRIEAQLYFWLAMAKGHLDAGADEVHGLLQRAQELDPEKQPMQRNMELIAGLVTPPISPLEWKLEIKSESEVQKMQDWVNRKIAGVAA